MKNTLRIREDFGTSLCRAMAESSFSFNVPIAALMGRYYRPFLIEHPKPNDIFAARAVVEDYFGVDLGDLNIIDLTLEELRDAVAAAPTSV